MLGEPILHIIEGADIEGVGWWPYNPPKRETQYWVGWYKYKADAFRRAENMNKGS